MNRIVRHRHNRLVYYALLFIVLFTGCKSGGINLFKAASPHELYQRKLVSAGLDKTAMGQSWIEAAAQSLQKAVAITTPHKETGYFSAEKVPAVAYQFPVTQGEKLNISLNTTPPEGFDVFLDLWSQEPNENPKLISSADTLGNPIIVEVDKTGNYLLRLQPELLSSGQYTLEISTGASLDFPVKTSKKSVSSFFGDGRDAGARKHEGIDIFAPRRTPAIAAAEGTVVRVNQNNLGGNVVWMRPKGKNYTLYYAHLDEQTAVEGQSVAPGDTLGLIGNTGNARTTAPHLHFGIYTSQGAVDPLPFVNPVVKPLPSIKGNLNNLNTTMRTKEGTVVYVGAASSRGYRAELPDGRLDFIASSQLSTVSRPLKRISVSTGQVDLLDQPDSTAAVKTSLPPGKTVRVLGNFGNYYLVEDDNDNTGWVTK